MIRIVTADEPASTIITVDGRLTGDSILALESSCTEAVCSGKPVQLFLRDVSSIDEGGRALLWRLAAQGVRLKAVGLYNSYVIEAITREAHDRLESRRPRPKIDRGAAASRHQQRGRR